MREIERKRQPTICWARFKRMQCVTANVYFFFFQLNCLSWYVDLMRKIVKKRVNLNHRHVNLRLFTISTTDSLQFMIIYLTSNNGR